MHGWAIPCWSLKAVGRSVGERQAARTAGKTGVEVSLALPEAGVQHPGPLLQDLKTVTILLCGFVKVFPPLWVSISLHVS